MEPANHTDVVSVEDLEALIGEARRLASEDAGDRLPAIVDDGDLVVELEAVRAAGGSGVSPALLHEQLLVDAYQLSHSLEIADATRDAYSQRITM